jgi:Fe-S-cluster-containing hydrogenase component 2
MNTPLHSLERGTWFKLICGASFQHLPVIRSLTLAYSLAGADCIDVCADPVVIRVAQEALDLATTLADEAVTRGHVPLPKPWLMVSLNDGEDPHFRKAEFDATTCPSDCPRPCESICPTRAITLEHPSKPGVIDEQCYGCGRCIPVCPLQKISTRSYVSTPTGIASLVLSMGVDALEIHTQVGRLTDFQRLWRAISPWLHHLKLIAISCPDGDGLTDYLWSLYEMIQPLPCALLWQTDGRPMSGDIGKGTTYAAVQLGQKVLAARLPGYVQLAGGTNHHTIAKLETQGLLKCHQASSALNAYIAGVAYGSYARSLIVPLMDVLELEIRQTSESRLIKPYALENHSEHLWQVVDRAATLVSPWKRTIKSNILLRNA